MVKRQCLCFEIINIKLLLSSNPHKLLQELPTIYDSIESLTLYNESVDVVVKPKILHFVRNIGLALKKICQGCHNQEVEINNIITSCNQAISILLELNGDENNNDLYKDINNLCMLFLYKINQKETKVSLRFVQKYFEPIDGKITHILKEYRHTKPDQKTRLDCLEEYADELHSIAYPDMEFDYLEEETINRLKLLLIQVTSLCN